MKHFQFSAKFICVLSEKDETQLFAKDNLFQTSYEPAVSGTALNYH